MAPISAWVPAIMTILILLVYEVALAVRQRRNPPSMAKTAHAILRREWFDAVSAEKGTEVLAIQAVRNSVMSATMISSIAALGLMGGVTLAMPSLQAGFGDAMGFQRFSPRLLLELVLLALLFASLAASVMAVRFYNHCGYVCALPVHSTARQRWHGLGAMYIQRAGLLYSWGVKHLLLVLPILAAMLVPYAGPVAALLVVGAMAGFDALAARPGERSMQAAVDRNIDT
ncbi:MAG: DUF599 domain-containing protein [Burkholderiaceae bacterium]|nr:DUF599 domain-containing protein [Burkholderiaceae bacterium]